jgi:hypothetical protein
MPEIHPMMQFVADQLTGEVSKDHPVIQFIARTLSDRFFSDPVLRIEVASSTEPFNALVWGCIPASDSFADDITHAVRDALYDTPFMNSDWPQDAVMAIEAVEKSYQHCG